MTETVMITGVDGYVLAAYGIAGIVLFAFTVMRIIRHIKTAGAMRK